MLTAIRSFINVEEKPRFLKFRSSKTFLIFIISFAAFTDIFLYSVIVPVVPFSLKSRAHVADDKVSTYVTVFIAAYGAALALTSPLFGYIADHTRTRRAPFLLGLLVLTAATIMLHLGRSIGVLIFARILQGASASVVWIVGLAMMADTVSKDDIGAAMGYVYLAMSLGLLMGPLVGGVVFDKVGYNAVFILSYVLVGFDIFLRLVAVERGVARRWLSAEEAGEEIELRPVNEEVANVDAVVVEGTGRTQGKTPASLVTLLRSKRLIVALWGSMVMATLLTSLDAVLALYVEATFHWTSLGAGLLFLALCVPSFLGPFVGWASDRFGPKWISTAGFLLAVPVETLFRLVKYNTLSQKVLLVALLALLGVATDLIITPIMAEITCIVEKKSRQGEFGAKGAYAQAYGLFNFAFALGCLIGPLWGGFVQEKAGWGTMTWSLGALCAVSAVPTAIWCGGKGWGLKED
ncbi:MFS transporter [Microthyrium microscopicum]|uniref:MFS transporter n=1 Tax=Microthyrium microscopicum TaxID=703497 RepID=A0A6A6TTX7_9PEZI|nr:MFS transporter [Microthyrium microscopicum]